MVDNKAGFARGIVGPAANPPSRHFYSVPDEKPALIGDVALPYNKGLRIGLKKLVIDLTMFVRAA
jgi:hypothetical protein